MKTEKYEIVIGIIEGYDPDADSLSVRPDIGLRDMCILYQKISQENPIQVVSGVIDQVVTVYSQEWGSPKGGELCYRITCQRNPIFDNDPQRFKEAVIYNTKVLKNKLKQKTVTITINDVDLVYLTGEQTIYGI